MYFTHKTALTFLQIDSTNPVLFISLSPQVRYHQPCLSHDYSTMVPTIFSSYVPNLATGSSSSQSFFSEKQQQQSRSRVFAESLQLEESLLIPGSSVHLIYRSSSAPGSHATLEMKLTPAKIPQELHRYLI